MQRLSAAPNPRPQCEPELRLDIPADACIVRFRALKVPIRLDGRLMVLRRPSP
jgi:hypothetical protein